MLKTTTFVTNHLGWTIAMAKPRIPFSKVLLFNCLCPLGFRGDVIIQSRSGTELETCISVQMVPHYKITMRSFLPGIFNIHNQRVFFFFFCPIGYLLNKDLLFIMATTEKILNVHHLEDNELHVLLLVQSRKITFHKYKVSVCFGLLPG